MKYKYRLCYKNGIAKKENELYEFHKLCNCEKCEFRYKYMKSTKNALTVTTNDKKCFSEVEKFMESWKCGSDSILPTKYVSFMKGNG